MTVAPRFSVINCTWNHAHVIEGALQSLSRQTLSDFELLVVDDGSTDTTRSLLAAWAAKLPMLRYLPKQHTGLSDSRNYGIAAAAGTHLAFIDSDDQWTPDYLASMRDACLAKREGKIFCCNGTRIAADGNVLGPLMPGPLAAAATRAVRADILVSFVCNTRPSATVVERSTMEQLRGYRKDYVVSEDAEFFFRAAAAGIYPVYLDRSLVLYRHSPNSLSGHVEASFRAWLAMYQEWLCGREVAAPEDAARCTRNWALRSLALLPPTESRRCLLAALQVFPGDPVLRATYTSTYLGGQLAAKVLRHLRRVARDYRQRKGQPRSQPFQRT